jgi:intracellular sulfur oxidation DsrE/DsrF family protein
MLYRSIAILLALILVNPAIRAQGRADMLKANESKLQYPLFKGSLLTGILPVEKLTMPYSNKGKVKLAFDVSEAQSDPTKPSESIEEVMRIMNLHVAAGVKPDAIDAIVIVHGPGAASFLNNENYVKRFNKGDNPNLPLISEMQAKGMKFVVCGQTLALRGFTLNNFADKLGSAYSAMTLKSDLNSQGYMIFPVVTH